MPHGLGRRVRAGPARNGILSRLLRATVCALVLLSGAGEFEVLGTAGRAATAETRIAKDAFEHGYKYHPRVRARGVEDPVAHNFPYSFDDVILKEKPIVQSDGSLLYRKAGSINGKDGLYEIAVNPETNTIFHRMWRSR
jgi:hypothetical protein